MMRKFLVSFVLVFVLFFGVAMIGLSETPPQKLHFPTSGFSIKPLEISPDKASLYQPLTMLLPPSEGFASNVNVQIQPHEGSMEEYASLSRQQFKTMNLDLIKEKKLGDTVLVMECSGTMQGRQLHFYAKAISTGKKVYLATAAATEKQWQSNSEKLVACVDSLALLEKDSATPDNEQDTGKEQAQE